MFLFCFCFVFALSCLFFVFVDVVVVRALFCMGTLSKWCDCLFVTFELSEL